MSDKLTECYALKIPKRTKDELDKLSKVQKDDLNQALRLTMARKIHEASFDPSMYLGE